MKRLSLLLVLLVILVPFAAFAFGPAPDAEAVVDVGEVVDAVDSGSAIAIVAAVIMVLVNLLKAPWLGGLVKKIPPRWRIALPVVLGGVAGILSSVVLGMTWTQAIMIGLFSGPTAVFAHEAVVEAIMGRSKSRKQEPSG